MSLRLYRPRPGGLEPAQPEGGDWRDRLRSRRWRAAKLANPEAVPVAGWSAILVFGSLAIVTLVLLVIGYGTGFWG
jgi:hypothetical protein